MLYEEGILVSYVFMEISRKDLVGMYVEWTAPNVAKVWDEARGGTIFIDKAYSLLDYSQGNSFSKEALAEIVRKMVNDPTTLVIFAGYTEEMKEFVKNANSGLRSRFTNILEFSNYNLDEMYYIFKHLLEKEEYKLENEYCTKKSVKNFVILEKQ